MSSTIETIAVIEKNRGEEFRVAIKEFKGRRYLDVRSYVEPYSTLDGDRVPTKKGITIPFVKLGEIIEALQAAQVAVSDASMHSEASSNG